MKFKDNDILFIKETIENKLLNTNIKVNISKVSLGSLRLEYEITPYKVTQIFDYNDSLSNLDKLNLYINAKLKSMLEQFRKVFSDLEMGIIC